jgi:hypothetical protein
VLALSAAELVVDAAAHLRGAVLSGAASTTQSRATPEPCCSSTS